VFGTGNEVFVTCKFKLENTFLSEMQLNINFKGVVWLLYFLPTGYIFRLRDLDALLQSKL
jgi:hypothetical protein